MHSCNNGCHLCFSTSFYCQKSKKKEKEKEKEKSKEKNRKTKKLKILDNGDVVGVNNESKQAKKHKSKKRKADTDIDKGDPILGGLDYDKLFKATGGVRCGMRARASQEGKWRRAENM